MSRRTTPKTASRGPAEPAKRGAGTKVAPPPATRSRPPRVPLVRPPAAGRERRAARPASRGAAVWRGLVDALRRVPRTAWVCAAVAALNGACWSVISPPFQVTDEASHYAYVQRLAETGTLPTSPAENFPPAEEKALVDLRTAALSERPGFRSVSSEAEQRQLEHDLARPGGLTGSPDAGVATGQPPLYYALETIPYGLASGGTVLDRLAAMRLLSALFGGLTALFAYLFLREALPEVRWAWTVGGLGVAAAPLLGVMSGAVNPDALLFAVSAALFYCLARGFRRGITKELALALAAVVIVGTLTKLTFLCLLPGTLLGLVLICARQARTSPRTAGLAFAVVASPILLLSIIGTLSGHSAASYLSGFISDFTGSRGSRELSYIWQLYLPPLPGMSHDFHGILTTRTFWFNDLVGDYGWLDTRFPRWVYTAALVPAGALAVLVARTLFVARRVLPRRLPEALVYAAMGLGLLLVIGAQDYSSKLPGEYVEPRYLLPLIALWGAVLALAARGAGRRWGPAVGVAIVTLALAHNLFSQLLVIARYYS
jgi:hypothetical protein